MNDEYRVAQPQRVVEELRGILDAARRRGILPLTARAVRWMFEELTRTPAEFGESRERLVQLDLQLRIGFVGPLQVLFAVNVGHRLVLIRRISLQGEPGP